MGIFPTYVGVNQTFLHREKDVVCFGTRRYYAKKMQRYVNYYDRDEIIVAVKQ